MAAAVSGVLCLLRHFDLRLNDNPALHHAYTQATQENVPLYLLYCHDTTQPDDHSVAALWQHHNLNILAERITQCGGTIGSSSADLLPDLMHSHHIYAIHWNRRYDPAGIAHDRNLKATLRQYNIHVRSHAGNLFFEPFDSQILNRQGQPYKVYTPFANNLLNHLERVSTPLPAPHNLQIANQRIGHLITTLPTLQPWQSRILTHWPCGETHAATHCQQWLAQHSAFYPTQRDYPAANQATSRLSPYLACGVISIRQIFHAIRNQHDLDDPNLHVFIKELLWREFAYHILYHYPNTLTQPFQSKFNGFPWHQDTVHLQYLQQWQRGQTGIPLVDAGMRELWATGWMHNRVRMIVASWLTKDLRIHWRYGAAWFLHTLIDADLASNTLGWQWVAGCGVDAAPYFRIFNPITQAQKFDPEAHYIQRWLPELRGLTAKQCHTPWSYRSNYPEPMIDPKSSRKEALDLYQAL